jgi:hypothetical protein
MSTVQTSRSGRRQVVRRARPTLDQAWATALADLPAELHPAMIEYITTMRAAYDARSALSKLLTEHGVRWSAADRVAHAVAFSD